MFNLYAHLIASTSYFRDRSSKSSVQFQFQSLYPFFPKNLPLIYSLQMILNIDGDKTMVSYDEQWRCRQLHGLCLGFPDVASGVTRLPGRRHCPVYCPWHIPSYPWFFFFVPGYPLSFLTKMVEPAILLTEVEDLLNLSLHRSKMQVTNW